MQTPGINNTIGKTGISFPDPQQVSTRISTPKSKGVGVYRDSSGNVSQAPEYPDTSYGAYLSQGGNLLGIGYYAWRDKLVNDYQMAFNEYENWYNAAKQQKARISEAGLNTNLAYGAVSPGEASGHAGGASPSPSPGEVAVNAASVLTGVFGNLKTLAETATIVASLPESQFKGRMASMLNAGAAAGKLNSENIYWQQLFGNRVAAGVPVSKAQAEAAENALTISQKGAEKDYLDYMLTHGADGDLTDFEGSMFLQGRASTVKSGILEYRKNKQEWDFVFSKPEYWTNMLNKALNEGWITKGQAFAARTIIGDDKLGPFEKALALQTGIPGFFSKLSFFMTSAGSSIDPMLRNPAVWTIKEAGKGVSRGVKKLLGGFKKGNVTGKNSRPKKSYSQHYYDFFEDNYTD